MFVMKDDQPANPSSEHDLKEATYPGEGGRGGVTVTTPVKADNTGAVFNGQFGGCCCHCFDLSRFMSHRNDGNLSQDGKD